MNAKLFQQIGKDFQRDRKKLTQNGKRVLVYYDNVKSHRLTELMQVSNVQNTWDTGNLVTGRLIANATHFQQPVDVHNGANFKRILYQKCFDERNRFYKYVEKGREKKYRGTGKWTLSEFRIQVVKWISKSWVEFLAQNKNCMVKSWHNSGLLADLKGTEDEELKEIRV